MDRFKEIFGFVPVGGPALGKIELQVVKTVLDGLHKVEEKESRLLDEVEKKAKTSNKKEELLQLLADAKQQRDKADKAYAVWHEAVDVAKAAGRYSAAW